MKKSMLGLSIFLAIVLFSNNIIVHGETSPFNINILQEQQTEIFPVTLYIDGQEIVANINPIVVNDRTFVPARAFFEKLGATVTWFEKEDAATFRLNDKLIKLVNNSNILTVNDIEIKMDVPAFIVNDRFLVPVRFICENLGFVVTWVDSTKRVNIDTKRVNTDPTIGQITNISYYNLNSIGTTIIEINNFKEYYIENIDSNKMALNIKNTLLPQNLTGGFIDNEQIKLLSADTNDYGARIVYEIKDGYKFNVTNEIDKIIVNTYTYSQTQLNYSKSGDRVYLSIPNTILTDEYDGKIKYYTETFSNDRKTYSITYQPGATSILPGTYNVNDNFLNYINVTKNDSTGEITVTFCAKDAFIYNINYRKLSKDSAITIIKPYADNYRTVFIDVGHGGADSGAYYQDSTVNVKEKDLNLDIAKRLNILLKVNNINTYLDRGDDTFVGLYERCNIANAMDSKVFVSIHNNAADPSSASGTLTLYYPLPDSKRLAEIVQNSLINTLGTYDRKVVVGDDLVVLKATNMTSIITETVFISNKDDRDKIMDPEFRQKAAEAICNGIIEYLNGL